MSNKTDVVVKLVLVFFVSLLSFSIGTYVGRKYSDNQHKMAQLEPNGHEETRAIASEHSETAPTKNKESLTDEEIAKLAEEFVTDDETDPHAPADAHANAKPETHGQQKEAVQANKEPTHNTSAAKPMPIAQEIASSKNSGHGEPTAKYEITKETAHPRIPSSIPPDVAQYSVGKFTVQIASFGTPEEAESRTHELQNKGYKAFVIPVQIKGKPWFRVSVGLFATEKEAKEYKSEFMAKTKVDNAIVQMISR